MKIYRSRQGEGWRLCGRFQGPYRVQELVQNSALLIDLNVPDARPIKVALNDLKLVSNLVEEGMIDHGMGPSV